MRAYARPYSPHPNAQPDYTQRMTHYAHTPIPLNFMSETRFMSEKKFYFGHKTATSPYCLAGPRQRDHQIATVSSGLQAIPFPAKK